MAAETRIEKTDSLAKPKARSRSIVGALLVAVLGVVTFYLGAQYYTAKRSTTLTAIAAAFADDGIILYRLASGEIDRFSPDDPYSPTVRLPMAPSFSVKDAQGKSIKPQAFYVTEGLERAVEVALNPQGKVFRIRELGGFFSVEGSLFLEDEQQVDVNGRQYSAGDAFFLGSGSLAGDGGKGFEGLVETGDTVKMMGYGDRALVVEVVAKAGRLSVSSNVEPSRVYVDGVLRGKTPLALSCAPGQREVLVRADGYVDTRTSVEIISMEEAKISAVLLPVTGVLNVTSTPVGADVYVEGDIKGKTPLKVAVSPGRHEVRLELAGYNPKTETVLVTADYEQPVSAILVRMAGNPGPSGNGSAQAVSRDVTIVRAFPSMMTFEAAYPAGYVDTFKVTGATTIDGWPATREVLERFLPGEQLRISLASDGSVANMSKTYSHSFTLRDVVQATSGSKLFLGAKWVECSLAWDAVVQDAVGQRYGRGISPGDTVKVHGASPSDIRFVSIEDTLGETRQVEGHLVATPEGLRVFGDSYIVGLDIPQSLQVADVDGKTTVPVSQVPGGSRIRFYIDSSQRTVWAELVWKANISASGTLSVISGASIRVAPLWDDLAIGTGTVVYEGSSRTEFYNLRVGDSVLAAGPRAGDIRFVWVQNRALYSRVVEAVVTTVSGRQEKAFFEITSSGLGAYPIYAGAQTTFGYPAMKKTLRAAELQTGDRVRLWLDDQRKVIWGEITDKTDTRASGVYLGVRDGFTYLGGLTRFSVRNDLTITGLTKDEIPQPGSRVYVAGTGSVLSYMEVLTDIKPKRRFKGTVLSSRDLLRVKGNWLYEEFPFAKDTWFVDWTLMRDGPVTDLFPGDSVTVSVNIADEAMFVERTYSPPFRFEGTVKARQGRIIVLTDKTSTKTIEVLTSALVYKDGIRASVSDLSVGDKVKVSGEDKNSVDIIVCGW